MNQFRVVERDNVNAVHMFTWSYERAVHWINNINPEMFMDKTLSWESFKVQCFFKGEWVDYTRIKGF